MEDNKDHFNNLRGNENDTGWFELIQNLSQSDLETLEKKFKENQDDKSQGLTKIEFMEAVSSLYDNTQYSAQSQLLFDDISKNEKLKITWSDFLDFLIQNSYAQVQNDVVLNLSSIETISHAKNESVAKIVLIESKKYFCYAIILKHGRIGLYDGNLNFLTSYHVIMTREDICRSEEERRRRNRWVTDAVFCPDVLMLIVTNTARSITIYDAAGLKHVPLWLILSTPNIIECFSYKAAHMKSRDKTVNSSFIFCGDSYGEVLSFKFLQPKVGLLRRKYNDKISLFYWMEMHREKDYVKINKYGKVHQNSIKRISYFAENDILVTCSRDLETSVIMKHVGNKRKTIAYKMQRGTTCFALSNFHKILLTGSDNGVIRLWNPVVTSRPVSVLHGHANDVVDLKIMKNQELFLSCARDGVLKLWCLRDNNKCLQTIKIQYPCFGIQGKSIEWGIECIYPGPKRRSAEEIHFKRERKKCFGIENISEQKEEDEDNDVSDAEDELQTKEKFDLWERSHIIVTCCNFIATIRVTFNSPEIESTFFMPVAQPPPLQSSVLIPESWKLQDSSLPETQKKYHFDEIDIQEHLKGLSFILNKDLLEEDGLKSDINYKLAILETKKMQMQKQVAQGAPYLALDLYDIEEVKLSENLPAPTRKNNNFVPRLEKLLTDANWKDQIFSESTSSSRSRRSSLRSCIVDLPM